MINHIPLVQSQNAYEERSKWKAMVGKEFLEIEYKYIIIIIIPGTT